MSEEIQVTPPEGENEIIADVDVTQQQSQPEYTDVEQEAMNHGWRPEAEFSSTTGKKWRTAEQFMELKPLYDKIDDQHKEVKNLRKGLENFGTHYKKVEQAAYNRALAELKAQRTTALQEGDLVKAEDIRDQMDEMRDTQTSPDVITPSRTEEPEEYRGWKQQNQWYQKDEDLTAYADGLGNKLLTQGKTPSEILVIVEKKTRQAFPDKFRNPAKDGAPRVETGTKKGNSGSGYQLTADETRIMESMIRSGVPISREDYIKDLKKVKGE